MADALRIEPLTGDALRRHLADLADLRIAVFRAFPYLYEGSRAYEERYLATYADAPGSVIVGARDGDRLVGAATGLPLRHEPDTVTRPLADAGLDVGRVFYYGESVLLPDYRGRGVGVRFFTEREAHARRLGGFDHAVFCAVDRPDDHPRRPAGHVPLDGFWRNRGFRPLPGVTCRFSWRDLDEDGESEKLMRFWIKDLA
ncbi:GNAT family N-acetyltransferase [Azospirillum halopraeferens]|uniref:GNAT family N-acetyltransferase n=1 Tax=Azospirillum halopraeferens TaxID=34010 RepID=UPI00042A1D97|nr:GNAT family N-acetyltransferase [Azospirillum halopraeferens]